MNMYNNIPYPKNVMSYHGPMNIELISFMANFLKDMVVADRKVIKRLFKVFIELTQNVSYYSAQVRECLNKSEARRGVGWFYINENSETFTIATGNLIANQHAPVLQKNCVEINKLSEEELRDLKRRTRMESDIRDIGAHIGLIHTGLISGNKLNAKITPVDDEHSFFTIEILIKKEITN